MENTNDCWVCIKAEHDCKPVDQFAHENAYVI